MDPSLTLTTDLQVERFPSILATSLLRKFSRDDEVYQLVEIAKRYESLCYRLQNRLLVTIDENTRLKNENNFMLRLLNERENRTET